MNRRVVVQILPALNAGGVERCTLETARALVAAGHRSIVISNGGRMVAQLESEGSEHISLPVHRKSLRSLLQIRPLQKVLAALQPDVLHARSRIPAWISWLALRGKSLQHKPHFVTTMHGLHSVSFYSAIMVKGEAVIAGSETVRRYITESYPQCPPARVHLIPEGVDPAEFPYDYQPASTWLSEWQRSFPELAGKTVLALPGRLTRLKGHATFIRLIAALRESNADVHGLIIGGAEASKQDYVKELESLIKTADLASAISFTGHRSDIRDVMSQCDLLFSLSTKPESFGRTVLEAIRLGKPVIGWDVGGVGEILAACYPSGRVDPHACDAETVLRLTTQKWLATRNKPAPSPHFLLADMCTNTLKLYEDVSKN